MIFFILVDILDISTITFIIAVRAIFFISVLVTLFTRQVKLTRDVGLSAFKFHICYASVKDRHCTYANVIECSCQ